MTSGDTHSKTNSLAENIEIGERREFCLFRFVACAQEDRGPLQCSYQCQVKEPFKEINIIST